MPKFFGSLRFNGDHCVHHSRIAKRMVSYLFYVFCFDFLHLFKSLMRIHEYISLFCFAYQNYNVAHIISYDENVTKVEHVSKNKTYFMLCFIHHICLVNFNNT